MDVYGVRALRKRRLSLDCANGVHHPDNCDRSTCECSCHEG